MILQKHVLSFKCNDFFKMANLKAISSSATLRDTEKLLKIWKFFQQNTKKYFGGWQPCITSNISFAVNYQWTFRWMINIVMDLFTSEPVNHSGAAAVFTIPIVSGIRAHSWYATGFEISLVRSSEMSKNDSRTSGIPARLVRRTTAYFWFWHKLHWLYIFQTSEWYIRTSDF